MANIPSTLDAVTLATAELARAMLERLDTPLAWQGDRLHHGASGFVAQMHFDCTAGWLVAVLLLAMTALGSLARVPWRRLARWAAVGMAVIVVLNQLRLVVVLWVGVHAPALFDVMHEWVSPLALVAMGAAIVMAALRPGARPSSHPAGATAG
ncbi:MAG: exosortase/archaeosortase family protein [Burkholderiales bacterium]|nr:exosortase/archaeosortase family protein [Burkholderiales bacterium]